MTNPNKTFGRISTMQCSRDDIDPNDPKAAAKQRLKEQQERYNDHASRKALLPPGESLALRTDIDRLSKIVDPDATSVWSAPSSAENSYLEQVAEGKRRFANSIGILAFGPVFGALPAAARLFGAPEEIVEAAAELNVNLASAVVLGGRSRVIEPVSNRPTISRVQPIAASPGRGAYVARAVLKTATEEIKALPKFKGQTKSEIEATLKERGYTSVPSNDGTGSVWTKDMSDGNTSSVRLDDAKVRVPPEGFADEVPHAHKEMIPTNELDSVRNYKGGSKFDDMGNLVTGKAKDIAPFVHIPILW